MIELEEITVTDDLSDEDNETDKHHKVEQRPAKKKKASQSIGV